MILSALDQPVTLDKSSPKHENQIKDSSFFCENPVGLQPVHNKPTTNTLNLPKVLDEADESLSNPNTTFCNYDEIPFKNVTNFDDMPIGKAANKFTVSEYPEGMVPEESQNRPTEAEQGPLSTRVKSKVFKIRQNAFTELATKFKESSPEDPIFQEYASQFPIFINDSHPGAQEKALEAIKTYLEKSIDLNLDIKTILTTLCDKAIGPGKTHIKKLSFEILTILFEKADKKPIFDALIESMNHKNQKVPRFPLI